MSEQQIYAIAISRVSTVKQNVFGDSLDDQEKQTEIVRQRLSGELGCKIKVIKTFPFAESASVGLISQPVQKVLEYCRNSKIPIRFAFFMCISRFTRGGAVVYQQLKMEFAKLGITIIDAYGVISPKKVNTLEHLGVSYWWSEFNPTSKNELLEAESSKDEITSIETRMIGGAIRAVRAGYWRGQTPLGFKTERVEIIDEDGKQRKRLVLKPHQVESVWFTKMFELTIQGKVNEDIVNEINTLGFITRKLNFRDKEDRTKIIAIKGGKKLTVKMLHKYIQSPLYAGVNTEKWLLGKPVYLKGGGIITPELFNRANKDKITIIDDKGSPKIVKGVPPDWQKNKLKLNPKYPYRQYLLCPICGRCLKASSPAGKLKHYPTYFCSEKHKYWGINADKLDNIIKDFVADVRFSDEFKEKFKANFIKNWNLRMALLNKDTINWEKRIIELREQKDVAENQLSMATTASGINLFERKVESLKEEINNATLKRNQTEDEEVDVQVLTNTAKYWMEHYEELVLTVPNPLVKASLFGQIFEKPPTVEELINRTPKLSHLFALNAQCTKGVSLQCGIDETRTRNLFRDREAL